MMPAIENERDRSWDMSRRKLDDKGLLRGLIDATLSPMAGDGGGESLSETYRTFLIERLVRVEFLVFQIGNSQADLFEIKAGRVRALDRIGEEILDILQEGLVLFDGYHNNFQFSPSAIVFMDEFEKIAPRKLILFCQDTEENSRGVCKKLNEAVSAIREKISTPELRKQICNFRRSSDKNLRSFQLYTKKCFDVFERLLVVRVDLCYEKNTFAGKSFAESFEMAKQHWQKWIRRLKERTGKAYVGYAKVIEYGIEKSFYFHVVLLLDGARTRQDVEIATRAGKDWSEVVTQGVGWSHNYNLKKDTCLRLGIGRVNADEKAKRTALDESMAFMIKIDYFMKLETPDGSRVFSRGDMPTVKHKSVRPRKTSAY